MNLLTKAPVCSTARRCSRCTPLYACPRFGCSAAGRQSQLHSLTAIPRKPCLPCPWVSLHVHVPICVSTVHAMQIKIHDRLGLLGHLHRGSDVQAYSLCADGKRFMDIMDCCQACLPRNVYAAAAPLFRLGHRERACGPGQILFFMPPSPALSRSTAADVVIAPGHATIPVHAACIASAHECAQQ